MMNTDSVAHRVAHRFRRDVFGANKVEYSSVGNIDAVAVARLLSPSYGNIIWIRFRSVVDDSPNSVAFEAMTERSEFFQGRVVLRTQVAADVITSWGQVLIDTVDTLDRR